MSHHINSMERLTRCLAALRRRCLAMPPPALLVAATLLVMDVGAALAHVGEVHGNAIDLDQWPLTASVVIPTVLVAAAYVAGMRRRAAVRDAVRSWRHAAFLAGLAAVFLSIQSPLDTAAEHLFAAHQVQHLLLRAVGPMLIALAWPQATLLAGLPGPVRRGLVAPVVANPVVGAVFGFLAHPVVATAVFVGAMGFWQLPAWHQAALLSDPVHDTMHLTMLGSGLFFWWRAFDRRPAPQGLGYGTRLMMLWLAMLASIGLGAYTTFKSVVLYPAYDTVGRLYDYAPLVDERIGGLIIWIPGAMMGAVAILLVVYLWGRQEARADDRQARRRAGRGPMMAADMVRRQQPKNRLMAFGFAAFAIFVFVAALLVGLASQLSGDGGIAGRDPRSPVHHAAHGEPARAH